MLWNAVTTWIAGALFLSRGLNTLNLPDILMAALYLIAGTTFCVKCWKLRKENQQDKPLPALLQVVLTWVCCGSFFLRGLDMRNLFDFLLAALFLVEGCVDSALYGKNRKENQKEKD